MIAVGARARKSRVHRLFDELRQDEAESR